MKRLFPVLTVASLTACASLPPAQDKPIVPASTLTPPPTRADATPSTHFGVTFPDPYRWLEPTDSPDVAAWVTAQDAFTRHTLDPLPGRTWLTRRLSDLFYVDSVSPPYLRGTRYFWTKRDKTREKAHVYWQDGAPDDLSRAQLLLDPNTWSTDGSVSLGGYFPSRDGRFVAYAVKRNNADEAILEVLDVTTGQKLTDRLDGAKYASPSWTPDGRGFYYVFVPPVGGDVTVDNRPGFADVRFHTLGTPQAEDRVIFTNTGSAETFLDIELSRDGRYLVLTVQHGWNQTDIWFKDLQASRSLLHSGAPAPATASLRERLDFTAQQLGFTPLMVGEDALASVIPWRNTFYILTNSGAPRYRVLAASPKNPARSNWRELIPERDATLDGLTLAGDHFLLQTLHNATSQLEVWNLQGQRVRTVELPGLGSLLAVTGDPTSDTAFYSFTSFTHPTETWKTSVTTGKSSVWAKIDLPVDTSRFEVRQVFYSSKDGTKISMFIVQPKGLALTGDHPVLLYGYGGFNVNITPAFAGSIATWLELGGVYAVPNLRGGGEYGEAWHRDGMHHKKQNVFDDFIGAAEYLIREGYTRPDRLAIRGGSNGGLLVGAAMTQRPDLFGAVICAVPLLDMVRYHLFGSGRTWIPEYGNPDEEADFKTLYAYSPYHRVVDGVRYPALLMLGAADDDRVDPMHARKFVARVQAAEAGLADPPPTLFRLERNSGHGGGDMVKSAVAQFVDQYAFLAWRLGGITFPAAPPEQP